MCDCDEESNVSNAFFSLLSLLLSKIFFFPFSEIDMVLKEWLNLGPKSQFNFVVCNTVLICLTAFLN